MTPSTTFQLALLSRSDYAAPQINRGLIYFNRKKITFQHFVDFQETLRLQPDYPGARVQLSAGLFKFRQG